MADDPSDALDDAALAAPARFIRPHVTVDALRFDGTRACAVALARAFPNRIAHAVEPDDVLLAHAIDALGHLGLHVVERGCWLVRGTGIGDRLQLLHDDLFRAVYVLDTRDHR